MSKTATAPRSPRLPQAEPMYIRPRHLTLSQATSFLTSINGRKRVRKTVQTGGLRPTLRQWSSRRTTLTMNTRRTTLNSGIFKKLRYTIRFSILTPLPESRSLQMARMLSRKAPTRRLPRTRGSSRAISPELRPNRWFSPLQATPTPRFSGRKSLRIT